MDLDSLLLSYSLLVFICLETGYFTAGTEMKNAYVYPMFSAHGYIQKKHKEFEKQDLI